MIRALMPLRSLLSVVAVGWQVAATFPSEAAVIPLVFSCEQPTNSTAVPPPKSEADIVSIMNQWMTHQEAISQMKTWWRERSKQPGALASEPMPPATKEAASQMEKWWQQRTELQPAITTKQQRLHRRQRYYAASSTEFRCPPSVCSNASSTAPTQPLDQQAQQQYRQAEELYQRQLELQRAQQGR